MSNLALLGIDPSSNTSPEGSCFREHDPFCRIWIIHHEYLFGLSLRWMHGHRADAEDALSSAKLKAMRYFRGGATVIFNERAWLSRLLYNACMDHYRRKRQWEETDMPDSDRTIETARSDEPESSPEDGLLERELYRQISELLEDLSPGWRNAFVARFVREESYEEIARRERTTEANIRKRVQLARRFLRERLAERGLGLPEKTIRRRP